MKHLKKQFSQSPALALGAAQRRAWMEGVRRDIAAFDWHCRDGQTVGAVHPEHWRAWLRNGPCKGCPCEPWCDTPCSLRLRWWNDVVGVVRRRLRG